MPILTEEERLGTLIDGKYRLERVVGRGGMGVVFAGTHIGTGRTVALKLLLPEYSRDGEIAKRFIREARTAGQMNHPNVVSVLDVGRDPDGTVFMVLEYLEGETLSDVLDRHRTIPPRVTVEMVRPVMEALAVAHDRSIVHRDIKPENIFLTKTAEGKIIPKLLDFGLAKVIKQGDVGVTRIGSVLGTVEYMSPEQAQGAKDIGPQTDIWSVGVVLFECITGRRPFDADSPAAIAAAIVSGEAPSVRTVAPLIVPGLANVIDKALKRDRAERYDSMKAFIAALDEALRTLPDLDDYGGTKIEYVRPGQAPPEPRNTPVKTSSDLDVLGTLPLAIGSPSPASNSTPPPASVNAPQPTPSSRTSMRTMLLGGTVIAAVAIGTWAGFQRRGTETPQAPVTATQPTAATTPQPAPSVAAPPAAAPQAPQVQPAQPSVPAGIPVVGTIPPQAMVVVPGGTVALPPGVVPILAPNVANAPAPARTPPNAAGRPRPAQPRTAGQNAGSTPPAPSTADPNPEHRPRTGSEVAREW